jgi:hypothetical protein
MKNEFPSQTVYTEAYLRKLCEIWGLFAPEKITEKRF